MKIIKVIIFAALIYILAGMVISCESLSASDWQLIMNGIQQGAEKATEDIWKSNYSFDRANNCELQKNK